MGRQVKRVALDFDWPLKETWKGYVFPFQSKPCYGCAEEDGRGSYGYSKEAQKLSQRWYGFDCESKYVELGNGRRFNDNALMHHLDQDDVDELAREGRLMDFTHTWMSGKGWCKKKPVYHPTAEEVNEWSKQGMGHDSINQGIVVELRCKKMGVPYTCTVCGGSGDLWQSEEIQKQAEEWEGIEPPTGEGWQLWETVSEGSPISPVFKTATELVDWLVSKGDAWGNEWTRSQAEAMVSQGWTPSGLGIDGKFLDPQQAAEHLAEATT